MIIVGGTYREFVARPEDLRVRGSGLRAAVVLRSVPAVRLYTAVSPEEQGELDLVAAASRIDVVSTERDASITFSYFTPVSPPAVDGTDARIRDAIEVEGDLVLRFGMLERDQRISILSSTLVIDPQGDANALHAEHLRYDRLVVVANEREITRLGNDQDASSAAANLRLSSGADAVVAKCGARGAIVVTDSGETRIGPRPTATVHPIGSGDAFTAAFSWALGTQNADPVEAARFASSYTADFVTSLDEPLVDGHAALELDGFLDRAPVYLAGPFFGLAQSWLVDVTHRALINLGAAPFSPVHDVGIGGPEVAKADLDGLDNCRSVLALVDDFDVGTIFEIGYAVRAGTPVVAYLDPRRAEHLTMLEGSGVEVTDNLSTAVYRAIWLGAPT